jgi:hypothetical protein
MIDVHAPEHPIHGVRDFFLHLFTITVGLLIALGLENTVEWRHHVHIRHEAESNLRHEIESNRKDLQSVVEAIPREQKELKMLLVFLQGQIDGKKPEIHSVNLGVVEATVQDASWNTASATGALSYMEYSEVQRFSSAYQLQKKFDAVQDQALPAIVAIEASLGTGDPNALKPAEAAETMRSVHIMMAQLETTRGLGVELVKIYDRALNGD